MDAAGISQVLHKKRTSPHLVHTSVTIYTQTGTFLWRKCVWCVHDV